PDADDPRAVMARDGLPGRADEAGRPLMSHSHTSGVDRRTALRRMAGAAASALWVSEIVALAESEAATAHLLAATPQGGTWTPSVLSAEQFETVSQLVELIIPATETPGAKDALVDRYVDGVLESAPPNMRGEFTAGL